jgi:hypothetical protein
MEGTKLNEMGIINISQLKNGLPTISSAFGAVCAEAAVFCLEQNSHQALDCILECSSNIETADNNYKLTWDKPDLRINETYGDPQEATEYGATGIALLLAIKLTNHNTLERSMKGEPALTIGLAIKKLAYRSKKAPDWKYQAYCTETNRSLIHV